MILRYLKTTPNSDSWLVFRDQFANSGPYQAGAAG